jgi:putative membrane protein
VKRKFRKEGMPMKGKNIAGTMALVLVAAFVGAWIFGYRPMGMATGFGCWPMGRMGMGGIMTILFWGLLLFGLMQMINGQPRREPADETRSQAGRNAREILARRYARGEIKKQEFESKMQDLRDIR